MLTIRRKCYCSVRGPKLAFSQPCDCAIGDMPRPVITLHADWRIRRFNAHRTKGHQLTRTERYPHGVCSRKGTKGQDSLGPAIGIGHYMHNRGLPIELSISSGGCKGDLNI